MAYPPTYHALTAGAAGLYSHWLGAAVSIAAYFLLRLLWRHEDAEREQTLQREHDVAAFLNQFDPANEDTWAINFDSSNKKV